MANKLIKLNFTSLVDAIRRTHEYMAVQAGRAVNVSLTLRNWVIGYYYKYMNRTEPIVPNTGLKSLNILVKNYRNPSTGVIPPDICVFAVSYSRHTLRFGNQ